jgi:hypothetical protein
MAMRKEDWTKINSKVAVEAPRGTSRHESIFVSPGGFFIPGEVPVEPYTQVIVRFAVEDGDVVAHSEIRRVLTETETGDRGIKHAGGGTELRIVRMEGDGSQLLADHIKKLLLASGGPGSR